MRHLILAAFAAALAISPCLAHTSRKIAARPAAPPPSPGEQCRIAIDAAERTQALPSHLLAAIGQVESGRRDPATQQWTPWPWTIDVGGQGTFYPTKADAIAAVQALQAQGIRSIDVGCVQINLAQHPNAFHSLEEAFDPENNARYGAAFLIRLFAMTRDWSKATAFYHSAIPIRGADYERKVLAVLSGRGGGALLAAKVNPLPQPPSQEQLLASAWAATLDPASVSSDTGSTMAPAFSFKFAPPAAPYRVARRGASPVLPRNALWLTAARDPIR